MDINDVLSLILVIIIVGVMFSGLYFFGVWGNTLDSKKKKTAITKSAFSLFLIIPLSLILLLLNPNDRSSVFQVLALIFVDVFMFSVLIAIIKDSHEESKKRDKINNDPLPLIIVGLFMLFILFLTLAMMSGAKFVWT